MDSDSILQSAAHHKDDADGLCFSANDSVDDVAR